MKYLIGPSWRLSSSRPERRNYIDRAFTIVELMIAFAIFSVALTVVISSFSFFSGKTTDMEVEVFLQQDVRNASYKLERRLSLAAEIISPKPVNSKDELIFRDLSGKKIKVKKTSGDPNNPIQTFEENDMPEQAAGKNQPVYIKNVESVLFTTLSPSAVMIKIQFKAVGDKKKKASESIFYVRLKNANATL